MTSEEIARVCEKLDALLADHEHREQLMPAFAKLIFHKYFNTPAGQEINIAIGDISRFVEDRKLKEEAKWILAMALAFKNGPIVQYVDRKTAGYLEILAENRGIKLPKPADMFTVQEAREWIRKLKKMPKVPKPEPEKQILTAEERALMEKRLWG